MRKIAILSGAAVVLILALAGAAGLRQATAGPDDVAVSIVGTAARAIIQYDITVSNKGTAAIGDIYVAGLIPQGAKFDSVVSTPKGASSLSVQGDVVAWVVASIPANGSVTMSYKVNAPEPAGAANAYVAWKSPSPGTALSASVSRQAAVETGSPKRGCTACHVGNYDLAHEAQARGGPNHPKLSSEANVNTCLSCHKAAADRTGLAPLMLRTIVHAAHINSDTFIGHYKGNCFTCHDISETGQFKLLGTKVTSNQYNVPERQYVNDKGYVASGQDIAPQPAAGKELLASMAKGGQIYDTWWKAVKAAAPSGNQPLWATQTTNTRTGGDTWRCKECHGWDYKGAAGAYGSGSHKTGFSGVMSAASTKSKDQLIGILKGSTSASHNFASQIGDDGIASLADFLKGALVDESKYIDYPTKKPIGANVDRGKEIYGKACSGCHGADGTAFNFGTAASPEYVATIAKDNPWEFTHKVRFGQPGTAMPAGIELGWSMQDVMDILAYSQTLKSN